MSLHTEVTGHLAALQLSMLVSHLSPEKPEIIYLNMLVQTPMLGSAVTRLI